MTPPRAIVTVFFSPWRYEAYEDVKAALIDAILARLEAEIPDEESEKRKTLGRLRGMAGRMRIGSVAAINSMLPTAMAFGAAHAGVPHEFVAPAAAALTAGSARQPKRARRPPSAMTRPGCL